MKKILSFILCALLSCVLFGCSSVSQENDTQAGVYEKAPEASAPIQQSEDERLFTMTDDEIEEYVTYFLQPLVESIDSSMELYVKETADGITVWKSGDAVMKKEISSAKELHQYYYDPESGALMLAVFIENSQEYSLYFKSGELVRYVDVQSESVNNPVDDAVNEAASVALSEAY